MALTCAAAPLMHLNGAPTLHLAAGLARDEITLCSHVSSPLLDNAIALAGVHVHHDGSDVNRQNKVDYIVQTTESVVLRVCQEGDGPNLNCGPCRKCMRTQVAVLVAGGNPRPYGFPAFSVRALERFGRDVAANEAAFASNEIPMWQEIQAAANERRDQPPGWLLTTDFAEYHRQHSAPAPRSRRLMRRIITRAPQVQHRLKSLVRLRKLSRFLP